MLPSGVVVAFFLIGAVRETFVLYCEERARGQELHEALVKERERRAVSVRDQPPSILSPTSRADPRGALPVLGSSFAQPHGP